MISFDTNVLIYATAAGAENAWVRYVLRITAEGAQPQEAMSRRLELLRRAVTVLEH